MATIVTRSGKGSPLTHGEVDSNFTNLNTDKLETAGGSMTGNLSFGDNDKAIFGAGSDLQIYHDGSNSYVSDQGAGDLILRGGNNVTIQNATGGQTMINALVNNAVSLSYNGNTKLATTSTGVNITGTLTSDGLTVAQNGATNVTLGEQGSGDSTTITIGKGFDAESAIWFQAAAGNYGGLVMPTNEDIIISLDEGNALGSDKSFLVQGAARTKTHFSVQETGDISFYEDTGTTAKFFWDASNEALGINTTTFPSLKVKLAIQGTAGASGSTTNTAADEFFIDNDGDTGMTVGSANTGTGYYAFADSDVALRGGLFYDHSTDDMGFRVSSGTRMTIDSSGNVGIGTSSPVSALDVTGTVTADGLTVDGDAEISASRPILDMMCQGASNENLRIDVNVGTLRFRQLNDAKDSATERFHLDTNTGDISFYEDTGTTAKFFWDASAEKARFGGTSDDFAGSIGLSGQVFTVEGYLNNSLVINAKPNTSNEGVILQYNGNDGFILNNAGNVGIGTSSPSRDLEVYGAVTPRISIVSGNTSTGSSALLFGDADADNIGSINYAHVDNSMRFSTNSAERMRIDSSGNVGIGTTTNSRKLNIQGDQGIRLFNDATDSYLDIDHGTDGAIIKQSVTTKDILFRSGTASGELVFETGGAERMRIDSSGNLLVGTTNNSPAANNVSGFSVQPSGLIQASRSSYISAIFNRKTDDGDIVQFRKDGTTVGSIGTSGGAIYIGQDDTTLRFDSGGTPSIKPSGTAGATLDATTDLGDGSNRWKDLYLSGGLRGDTTFKNNAGTTEYARFDSSGNLLLGTTDSQLNNESTNTGVVIRSDNQIQIARSGGVTAYFNRLTSDGHIVQFRKDGSTVGSIGSKSSAIFVGTSDTGVRFDASNNQIRPWNTSTNAIRDGNIGLGSASGRFTDIYATNGTIQTSDQNEKQDIAELSDAEQRVAVAAKGLLRKFRWKDAVAEKGDGARTHFGIIAQDLQAAFAAEGLDAGDYAMFIHTTWTDEETNEERSRMGVRYSELLAFIIAAI